MPRAAALSLALLLVAAGLVAGTAASGHSPGEAAPDSRTLQQSGDVALLMPGTPAAGRVTEGTLDAGATVSLARADAGAQLDQYAFEAKLEESDNRTAAIDDALSRIGNLSTAISQEERDAWQSFVNDTIDEAQLRRQLAETSTAAISLLAWLDEIDPMIAERTPRQNWINRLRRNLGPYDGPVRSRMATELEGNVREHATYVSASPDGITLSTIVGGQHIRETYRYDRQSYPAARLSELSRIRELQGIIVDRYNLGSGRATLQSIGNLVYIFGFQIDTGSIAAFLDVGTEQVYYEVQRRMLDRLDGQRHKVVVQNDTRMVVNRSYAGGPLRIATYNNETGVPVSSTIELGGRNLTTGDDGVLWTLVPRAGQYEITARTPTGRVVTTVWSVTYPALDEST